MKFEDIRKWYISAFSGLVLDVISTFSAPNEIEVGIKIMLRIHEIPIKVFYANFTFVTIY